MPTFYFHIEDGDRVIDRLGVELDSLAEARIEATALAAELIRDRPEALWLLNRWSMTVTDDKSLILFVITVSATASPTAAIALRA